MARARVRLIEPSAASILALPYFAQVGVAVRLANALDRDVPNGVPHLCKLDRSLGADDGYRDA